MPVPSVRNLGAHLFSSSSKWTILIAKTKAEGGSEEPGVVKPNGCRPLCHWHTRVR